MSVTNSRKLSGELLASFDDAQTQNRYYYHFDALGSTVDVTDGAGSSVGSYAYGAWGAVAGTTGATVYPYLYVGQLGYYTHTSDQGTEVQRWLNLGVRFYDPEIGRFERRDPLPQNLTAYSYCGERPLTATDASGLAPTFVDCSAKQRQRIQTQLRDIAANRLACIGTRHIRDCIRARLQNVVITCSTAADRNCAGNFGYTPYPQPRRGITVCPSAFGSIGTCLLQRTLMHEMAHSCDTRNGPPPGGGDPPVGWQCEEDCYPPGTVCPR